jgi:hypothetical protein
MTTARKNYRVIEGDAVDLDCACVCGPCADVLKASKTCADPPEGTRVEIAYGTMCQVHPTKVLYMATSAIVVGPGWIKVVRQMHRRAAWKRWTKPLAWAWWRLSGVGRSVRLLLLSTEAARDPRIH